MERCKKLPDETIRLGCFTFITGGGGRKSSASKDVMNAGLVYGRVCGEQSHEMEVCWSERIQGIPPL